MKIKLIILSLFFLNSLNSQTLKWANDFGCSGKENYGTGITSDKARNIIATGFLAGTIDFNTGPGVDTLKSNGTTDMYLVKCDPNGNFIWGFNIGVANDTAAGYGVCLDSNANIFVCGAFTGTIDFDPGAGTHFLTAYSNNGDAFLAKYDSSGNFLWAINLGGNKTTTLNTNSNQASGVVSDGSNVYVTGYFQGTPDFDPGSGIKNLTALGEVDVWVGKYDANANYSWAFRIGSVGNTYDDMGNGIDIDKNGNIFVTGYFEGTADFNPGVNKDTLIANGHVDIFLAKYDTSGNYIWAFNVGCPNSIAYAQGISVSVDTIGNAFLTGFFEGTADFDPDTTSQILVSVNPYNADIFLAKYSSNGKYLWAFSLGSSVAHQNYGYGVTNNGINPYLSGRFKGNIDFDPGTSTHNISSLGVYDAFLASYDAGGNYNWAFNIGSAGSNNVGYSISIDKIGDVLCTGWISSSSNDFDPNSGTDYLNCAGIQDIFIAKYSTTPTGVKQFDNYLNVEIYPNPSNGDLKISAVESIQELRICDILGNIVSTAYPDKNNTEIAIESEGIYFLHLKFRQRTSIKKIIILK